VVLVTSVVNLPVTQPEPPEVRVRPGLGPLVESLVAHYHGRRALLLVVAPDSESSHWHPSHDCGTIAGAGTRLISSIPRCSLDRLTFKLVQTPGRPLALVAAAQKSR
jgi:hypothetical protein